MPGSNTLPNAIAIPHNNVPKNNAGIQPIDRIEIPNASKNIAPSSVPPIPNCFVNNGVKAEITPKAITGKVVNKPNMPFERPVALLMSSIKGPTAANAGRKLIAMHSIPATNKVLYDFAELFNWDLGIGCFIV